jgi:hypothetical protein
LAPKLRQLLHPALGRVAADDYAIDRADRNARHSVYPLTGGEQGVKRQPLQLWMLGWGSTPTIAASVAIARHAIGS